MANTAQLSFRIDEDVKKNAERALNDMGLTMSAAITVFLKKVGRERRIPFEISADSLNTDTILAIQEVEALKKDANKKVYSSFSEVLKELEADE